MEDFQNLSLTIEGINESEVNFKEDDKLMISLLSEMAFMPHYEQYVINIINKIIKDSYKKIHPIFEEKNYNVEEIIAEYRDICFNMIKYKDKLIKSANIGKNETKIKDLNISNGKNKNLSQKVNSDSKYFESFKFNISIDKIFNDEKEKQENKTISLIIENNDEKVSYIKNKEINNFSDSFNFNGKIYELHIQSLLMQIFKCFDIKENSFQFLCNINEKKIEDLNEIELDFLVNNMDSKLLEKSIYYLSKNILLCNFKGNIYEINGKKPISDIKFKLEKGQLYDVLGEIGLNALDDEHKIEQFIKYKKLLNYLNEYKNDTKYNLNNFLSKTGFKKNNEKIIFFISDSKYTNIKNIKESKLYKEMKNSNVNFVLLYLNTGLNEQVILSDFLSKNEKSSKDNILCEQFKISNKDYIRSEKFRKSCYILNDLLGGLNEIKKKFYDKYKPNLYNGIESFSYIFFDNDIELKKIFKVYLKYIKLPIEDIYKINKSKKVEIITIYLKSGLLWEDNITDKLMKMDINTKIIIINNDENIIKNSVDDIRKNHKMDNIYLIVCNYKLLDYYKMNQFIIELIIGLNMNIAHYIFLLNHKQNEVANFYETLNFNIIKSNENDLTELINKTLNKIKLYSNDLENIYKEKKYYDKYIEVYIKLTKNKILKSSKDDKADFLVKINEAINFMSYLEFKEEMYFKVDEKSMETLFQYIDKRISQYIDLECAGKIKKIFNEISGHISNQNRKLLEISELNTKELCKIFLRQCTLKYMYDYFIAKIIPSISFHIYNQKLEEYLTKMEKRYE